MVGVEPTPAAVPGLRAGTALGDHGLDAPGPEVLRVLADGVLMQMQEAVAEIQDRALGSVELLGDSPASASWSPSSATWAKTKPSTRTKEAPQA